MNGAYAGRLQGLWRRALGNRSLRGAALSFLIQTQLVPVQLATSILLARLLGPAQFGTYSFAIAAMSLIQIMPNSGLDNVVIRYSASYHAERSWTLLSGLWRTALAAAVGYGLLTAGLVAGAVACGWLPATAALSPPVLAAAAIPMLFLPLLTVLGAAVRAVHPGVVGQLPQFVVKPWIYLAALVAVVLIAPHALSAVTAMYAQGATAAITVAVGGYWLVKYRPEPARHSRPAYEFGRWFRSVLPLSLMGGLMLINLQADILMLGLLGSAHDTGLFKVAAQGAALVALSLAAANVYIAPRIAALHKRGERARLQRLLALSVRSTFAVALLVACLFWVWGGDLIKLVFGAAYGAAFGPLALLCLGQLINVGAGSVGLILNMTGHEHDTVRMAAIAAVLNVTLNASLIPLYGGMGAAASTVITMLVWNGLMLRTVKRHIGVDASIFCRIGP